MIDVQQHATANLLARFFARHPGEDAHLIRPRDRPPVFFAREQMIRKLFAAKMEWAGSHAGTAFGN